MTLRRLPVLLAVIAAACVAAGNAAAGRIVEHDAEGRAIRFDVRAPGADVDWYASLLRRAAHGDEISTLTIRIVPARKVRGNCGHVAEGCYLHEPLPTLVVPVGRSHLTATILLHEYAHHLDRAWSVLGADEPNGTPAWWALRGMAEFDRGGAVAETYRLGWDRGIGEIFAEDYAYIHVGGPYGIPWLYPPTRQMKKLLLAELNGESFGTLSPGDITTQMRPTTYRGSGTLAPGARHVDSFRLLGPGRRVTLTASMPGAHGSGGRADVTCDGKVVRSSTFAPGRPVTLDIAGLGPASCRASVVNTGRTPQRFSFRLRLAVEP